MLSIAQARREFALEPDWIYLNHAAISPLPLRTAAAMREFADGLTRAGPPMHKHWLGVIARARRSAARLLNCGADEIAFIRNTTQGIILIAQGIDWHAGDNIVLPQYDFPANVAPWLQLRKRGVEVRFVPESNYGFDLDALAALIDARTRLVSVSWVTFSTGFQFPLEELGRLCAERGVLFVVDAIQGLGACPLDVRRCRIDFLTCGGHKWLLAPEGCGIFYVAAETRERLERNVLGWLGVERPAEYLNYDQRHLKSAKRFEEGAGNTAGINALNASLEFLLEIGIENVAVEIRRRAAEFIAGLQAKGYCLHLADPANHGTGIISCSHPAIPSGEIVEALLREKVHAAARRDWIRFSPHFYNTREQVARVLDLLPAA